MTGRSRGIPKLFRSRFTVDYSAPFKRHLNRLEVEIGREDYRHLKKVELLPISPPEVEFAAMEEITERVIRTTQNNYNRNLLKRLAVRVYLDALSYDVYYRLSDRAVRFSADWRRKVLTRFFGAPPLHDTGWQACGPRLELFESRYLHDRAGGVLLLRLMEGHSEAPLLTVTHGSYDPHTFEVALFLLRTGQSSRALVNLGFSGREPLTDENLEKLKEWGIPLNPSNIDVIYPYVDASGHPSCYKLEEGLRGYLDLLEGGAPQMVIDIHGCVGTSPEDNRIVIGLGGFPPYPEVSRLGGLDEREGSLRLVPNPPLSQGLSLLRNLSEDVYLQFCDRPHRCYHFSSADGRRLLGRRIDPRADIRSLLEGEPRFFLEEENIRWLPGAGGNALQRIEALKANPDAICLHVEIPTAVRRRIALRLREMEMADSLDASSL